MRVPIVNEQDEILRYEDLENRDRNDIIRVAALWVTDKNGNILLAQRSFKKNHSPGMWGPAAAGRVEEGETYETNIIKEAREEIGLSGVKFTLGQKFRRSSIHESFVQWFTAVVDRDYPFVKQDEEVEAIKWFSRDELDELIRREPENFLSSVKEYKKIFS